MSRPKRPGRIANSLTCEICNEELLHDVARVDQGRLYHLRCFRLHVFEGDNGLYECPKCRTIGGTWSWTQSRWQCCTLCQGSGYLSAQEDASAG